LIGMKYVILAAGKGSRLLPYTEMTPKVLTTIGGVHLLGHHIDKIVKLGADPSNICVVTGYMREEVEGYLDRYYPEVGYNKTQQELKQGPAGGVLSAKGFIGNDWSALIEADTFFDGHLDSLTEEKPQIIVKKTEMKKRYAEVYSESSLLKELDLFSPNEGQDGLAFTGITVNPPGFCRSLKEVTEDPNTGEYYILSGVLIQNKKTPYLVREVDGVWFNVATIDDVVEIRKYVY